MKLTHKAILVLIPLALPTQAALVFGGDFEVYKPGTGYTVPATFGAGSFARGVGDGIQLAGGTISYGDGSADGQNGDGIPDLDLPGWETIQGGNDLTNNGVGGSTGMNIFAAWGGDGRIQTAGSLGTILGGETITITAMVGGPDTGPIQGPLAFHLVADGVQLTPTSLVDPTLPNGGAFQMISRTYDATSLSGSIGASTKIVLGVEDANNAENRVIFDDVSIEGLPVVPEPASSLLFGLGAVAMAFRRARKK
ncbi:PEP-CTERM sorting domain-containing protein [Akkermansiaceae bacterium]|nr:PEP-CTERM sorting domain-containing protein [Akkermansiaceae bacterium]